MARRSRPKADKGPHPITALLQREWVWARLAVHWRLYRSGYHLHARATWRRAHPDRRQLQRETSPWDLHLLLARRVVRSEEDRMSPEDWEALEQIKEQMQKADVRRNARAAAADPASLQQAASHAAPLVSLRELKQVQEYESGLLAAHAEEIGREAEAALVQMVAGNDTQAQAFHHVQIAALRAELAPAGSSSEELLLAAVIAKARFETLLWSAALNELHNKFQLEMVPLAGLEPSDLGSAPVTKAQMVVHARDQTLAQEQVRGSERRYLQALRELANLRQLEGPLIVSTPS